MSNHVYLRAMPVSPILWSFPCAVFPGRNSDRGCDGAFSKPVSRTGSSACALPFLRMYSRPMSCFSVRVLGTLQTSAYIYLVPVVTVLTSHILLDEHFTLMIRVGTILTLTGLVLSSLDILSEAYRFRGGKGAERRPYPSQDACLMDILPAAARKTARVVFFFSAVRSLYHCIFRILTCMVV